LGSVQLHGSESPEVVAELARKHRVVKAIQVGRGFRVASLSGFRRADGLLLDGFARGLHGGTGRTLDWNLARSARRYGRIILAGGLKPENIAEAIRVAQPYAVDIASGVELRPGRKDPARLRALFEAVQAVSG
jgi:phosphoribosylanthranilate isomerase